MLLDCRRRNSNGGMEGDNDYVQKFVGETFGKTFVWTTEKKANIKLDRRGMFCLSCSLELNV